MPRQYVRYVLCDRTHPDLTIAWRFRQPAY